MNILMHLNNVNLVERDDLKTLYEKFKLFKHSVCGEPCRRVRRVVCGTEAGHNT